MRIKNFVHLLLFHHHKNHNKDCIRHWSNFSDFMSNKKESEGATELLQIRNNLYLGNYAYCIAEDVKVHSDEAKLEKEILFQRAHIGLGQYDIVLSEIIDSKETPVPLRVFKKK